MRNNYLEIKLHKNKPAQQFYCTLLYSEPGYTVLRYDSDEPGLIADMPIEAGTTTIAHYWSERPYVAWRMFDRSGGLIGTLLHICTDVRIFTDHLSYQDMLLDVWCAPDGAVRILDEDEVQACAADGMLSADELNFIDRARQHIAAQHDAIIAGLAAFEHMNQSLIFTTSTMTHIERDKPTAADV